MQPVFGSAGNTRRKPYQGVPIHCSLNLGQLQGVLPWYLYMLGAAIGAAAGAACARSHSSAGRALQCLQAIGYTAVASRSHLALISHLCASCAAAQGHRQRGAHQGQDQRAVLL